MTVDCIKALFLNLPAETDKNHDNLRLSGIRAMISTWDLLKQTSSDNHSRAMFYPYLNFPLSLNHWYART